MGNNKNSIKTLKLTNFLKPISFLRKKDRLKLLFFALTQVAIGFLDLAGVAAVGFLGALSVTGVQSKTPGNRVSTALEILNIENFAFQTQVGILGITAAILLISRTIISIIVSRKMLFFLSNKSSYITSKLYNQLISSSLLNLQNRTNQENLYSLTVGVNSIVLGIIANLILVIADLSLIIVLLLALFYVDQPLALIVCLFFTSIAYLLYKLVSYRSQIVGKEITKYTLVLNEYILESFNSYREITVKNRKDHYVKKIKSTSSEMSHVLAENQFLPSIGKYIIETSVVVGALILAAIQFKLQDASRAVATLAVFMAAGTRIAPAILRIQSSAIQMKSSLGISESTLDLMQKTNISINTGKDDSNLLPNSTSDKFISKLVMKDIYFKYPRQKNYALNGINLEINPGETVAIVGPSGSGKTTLVDVILGLHKPSAGLIQISNELPELAISKWSGQIAYVPQDVQISNGTIKSNIGMGFSEYEINELQVNEAIEISQLNLDVNKMEGGINTKVGERGAKLSGGQRQRLGIARAMYTQPKFLVLDEATSSLDGKTESDISESIKKLKGRVTVVMIAHRLSTVREVDKIVYLKDGEILAQGTFSEVRRNVPEFDNQAKLMGL